MALYMNASIYFIAKKIVSRFWIKIENNIHFTRNILVVLTLTFSDVDVNLIMVG